MGKYQDFVIVIMLKGIVNGNLPITYTWQYPSIYT
jgi:hypothetical protein